MSRIEAFEKGKVFEILVKPNSRENSLEFDEEKKVFVARVKFPAEDGKANQALLKMIKKESGLDVKIISGATSKRKLLKLM
jgi:uncharacterized protein (TIGR00251 family)